MKTRSSVLIMVYAAMYIALTVALNWFNTVMPIIQMPNGGSLELLVIPLFIASYHLGWKWGAGISALSWVIGVMFGLNDYIVSIPQVLLDYVLPFVGVGLASMMPAIHLGSIKLSNIYTGVCMGMFLKYLSQTLSGVYFWFPEGAAAGSWAAWVYSAPYNFPYNFVTFIAAIILVPILVKRLNKLSSITMTGVKE